MFDYFKEFITDSNNYLLLLGILFLFYIINFKIDKDNIDIKFCIVNIAIFILSIVNKLSTINMVLVYIISTFIYLEIFSTDYFHKKIIKRPTALLKDYFYKIIFEYGFFQFLLSLFFISDLLRIYLKNFDIYCDLEEYFNVGLFIIGIFILLRSIVIILNTEFETLNFSEINEKINKVMSFSKYRHKAKYDTFYDMLVFVEDKSYFKRKKSYNLFCFSFIIYRFKRMYIGITEKFYFWDNKVWLIFTYIISLVLFPIRLLYLIIKIIIINFLKILKYYSIKLFNRIFNKKINNRLVRGYSTIEMQLIRTIAVKNGYNSHPFRRKIYEIIYSDIFFKALKDNYRYYNYNYVNHFKQYLLYLYINFAPVSINGKMYNNIFELYDKKDLKDISLEEFFIWIKGLSYRKINLDLLNSSLIGHYDLNAKKIKNIINKIKKQK